MGRVGFQFFLPVQAANLLVRHAGKQRLAQRRTVQRRTGPDSARHADRTGGVQLVDIQHLIAGANAQMHRFVQDGLYLPHSLPKQGHIVLIPHPGGADLEGSGA